MGKAVAGTTPTGSWLDKIGKLQAAGCRLCKRAREAQGANTQVLQNETVTSIARAAKGWQRLSRLPTIPSEGIYTTV